MNGSAREVRELLETSGFVPKKRWGQNFLVNHEARERIVRTLEIGSDELIWEIGGGTGALTQLLAERRCRLVVFEVDHGLVGVLGKLLAGREGCTVVAGDFCRTFPEAAERFGAPDRIVGNLPYRSASRMIAAIAGSALRPLRLLFTVQKELGERMAARPSTKAYSSFTVLCQARFSIRAAGDLGPMSFYPAPHVSSRIVLLEPRPPGLEEPDLVALQALTRLLFATRRKTMRRSLASAPVPAFGKAATEALGRLHIGTEKRPEELSVEQYIALSVLLREAAAGLPPPPEEEDPPLQDPGVFES